MLLHGNLMCWRQFEDVIPLLKEGWTVPVPLYAGTSAGRGGGLLVWAAGGAYEESH